MRGRSKAREEAVPSRVMTVAQVAAYLQLNRLTVYRYVREGRIPAARIGKIYRILREDVDRFLEARQLDATMGKQSAPRRARLHRPEEICVGPQFREKPDPFDPATVPGSPVDWILRVLH